MLDGWLIKCIHMNRAITSQVTLIDYPDPSEGEQARHMFLQQQQGLKTSESDESYRALSQSSFDVTPKGPHLVVIP